MTLFESAHTKIRRAREQTRLLKSRFERFYKRERDTVRQEIDAEAQEKFLVFRGSPIPLIWAIIIGEIIHDLRSALDHAITDLSIDFTGSPVSGSEFPVFECESDYFERERNGRPARRSGLHKVRGVSPEVQTVIEGLQPFRFTDPERPATISLIHQLNIADKHRAPLLCRVATTQIRQRVVRDIHPISNVVMISELENGTELARWKPVGDFTGEVDMEGEVAFEIAFGDSVPILRQKGVITVCEHLIRGADRVLYYLANPTLIQ